MVERPKDEPPRVVFKIFTPNTESDVPRGTVTRAKATCPSCHATLSPDRVRLQLRSQRGGADMTFNGAGRRTGGAIMLAVVMLRSGVQGRLYRLPTERDYATVHAATKALEQIMARASPIGLSPVPDEPLPPQGTLGFRVQRYGMTEWSDLFTARQKLSLCLFAYHLNGIDDPETVNPLCLALSRIADRNSALCTWRYQADQEKVEHVFSRQALPPVWDFAEAVPLSESTGSWTDGVEVIAETVSRLEASFSLKGGQVFSCDARQTVLPDEAAGVWFTDPPYYDAVPYADLSDFFFVWLKRALPQHTLLRDPFDPKNRLTPKRQEVVQDETKQDDGRPKDRAWFEETMTNAFAEGRRVLHQDGIGSVVFAHNTTQGWEALLSGMTKGGWVITGSWPITTEMGARLRARESAALATSVHLVCRPRTEDKIGDWGEVLRDLPSRVSDWMAHLEREGVRGADLVFACVGPALEIFSRYSKVEMADGRDVSLPDYLQHVWEEIGRAALRQVLGTDEPADFAEDARLTALFLWTVRQSGQVTNGRNGSNDEDEDHERDSADEDDDDRSRSRARGGYSLPFDIVRRFAQPLGIHLNKWEGRLIETSKGVVRLLPVNERSSFLVEQGVAHDLGLIETSRRRPVDRQLRLFESTEDQRLIREAMKARTRLKQETWSHLHLDSITTLDHVHKAMLLQRQGQSNALRELLFYEQHYRPEFVRLANALSALYPQGTDEKRLIDAMLLAMPR